MLYKAMFLTKTRAVFILVTCICFLAVGSLAEAKRAAPKEVDPVIHKGIRYVAAHFKMEGKEFGHGYIEAWDIASNRKLWDLRIYEEKYDPYIERDVQDVFITSLTIKDDHLVVTNERGEVYEVDLRTRKIRKVK